MAGHRMSSAPTKNTGSIGVMENCITVSTVSGSAKAGPRASKYSATASAAALMRIEMNVSRYQRFSTPENPG